MFFRIYDSWYINKSSNKNFYFESFERVRQFIGNYDLANKGNYLYSIVFCDDYIDIF